MPCAPTPLKDIILKIAGGLRDLFVVLWFFLKEIILEKIYILFIANEKFNIFLAWDALTNN